MKRAKKSLAWILALVLCLSMSPLSFAAGEPSIEASEVSGDPGDTVTVVININNNPGLSGVGLQVSYDSDVLEYQSAAIHSTYTSATGANPSVTSGNPVKLNWVVMSGVVSSSGEFASVTFKIKEGAAAGKSTVTLNYLNEDPDNITDKDMEPVAVTLKNGAVTVNSQTPPAEAPAITTASLNDATTGTAFSQTLAATGTAPITWSVSSGTLPGGLSLNSESGVLSGTPNAAGSYSFTIQAENAGGTNSKQYTMTVADPAPVGTAPTITTTTLENGIEKKGYSQRLSADGTAPITWSVSAGTLPPGLELNSGTGVLSGAPTTVGSYTFTVKAENALGNDTKGYTISIAEAPVAPLITTTSLSAGTVGSAYSQILVASGTAPIEWSVSKGSLPGGLTMDGNTGAITGTPTKDGSFTFTVQAKNAAGTSEKQYTLKVNAAPTAPSFNETALPIGAATVPYEAALDVEGTAPITFSIQGDLPEGLSFDSETGKITGTPVKEETKTVTITASNTVGQTPQEFTIQIKAEPPTITFDANEGTLSDAEKTIKAGVDGKVTRFPTPSRSGYNFNGWYTEKEAGDKVSANTVFEENQTLYAHWSERSSGGGSSTKPTENPVDLGKTENGTVKADPASAKPGQTVTLTVEPEEGYETDSVTVKDADGKDIKVTEGKDGTYTFTMPEGKAEVKAVFKRSEKPDDPADHENCPSKPYKDVDISQWYHEDLDYVIENGLMNGTSESAFEPGKPITRGMIVTMLHRMEGTPEAEKAPFADVEDGSWYEAAVNWAYESKVVNGVSETAFAPDAEITREQMAAMMFRYAEYKEMDVSERGDLSAYTDQSSISEYAKEAMEWSVGTGLINGMSETTLSPQGKATRAQAAAIFHRFCEM